MNIKSGLSLIIRNKGSINLRYMNLFADSLFLFLDLIAVLAP